MAILSKGTTYADGGQITSTNLNALVDSATFAAGAVESGGGLQLNGSSPAQLKVAGNVDIGTSNLTATGAISLGATTFNDNNITNVGSIAVDTIIADNTDVTIDAAGDIILDADGAQVRIKDGGTERFVFNTDATPELDVTGGDFTIHANTSDADIIFTGNDGGASITALTLDMSAAGAATFNDKITAVGTSVFTNLDISGDVDVDGTLETDALSIASTAVTATAAELNILDGVTSTTAELNYNDTGAAVGTVVASKTVTVNSDKDVTGFRNITLTGELDAGSLDVSGDIDVDGTANLDVVDIDGAVDMATTLAVAGNVDFNGDLDVDGTTNLDAVDIDGAVQIDSTLTVGVNDTGHDVKLFGATSGASMLWDESANNLCLTGPDYQLKITQISSGAVWYNRVDSSGRYNLHLNGTGDVLTAKSTGVGIGTVPSNTLHVKNTTSSGAYIQYDGQSNTEFGLKIESNVSGGNFEGDFANNGSLLDLFANSSSTSGGDILACRTQSATPVMLVRGNGRVGLGTASPAEKLDVVGAGRFSTGVTFGTDTAAANKLDDYEEGTFTPVLKIGGATTGINYGAAVGSYTKIGNLVNASFYVSLSSKGSATGNVTISVPFASANTTNGFTSAHVGSILACTWADYPAGYLSKNSSDITLNQYTESGGGSGISNSNLTDTSSFIISITYRV